MAAEMNSMGSIITRITVQKSWKVALAALALAGLLVSGAAAHVVTPLVADFNSGTDGFAYLDDTFRGTSQPNYASGSRLSSGGVSGGCLQVLVGGVNNSSITNMSGGWRRTFTLSEEAYVRVSFAYDLNQGSDYENDEISEVLVTVNALQPGTGGNDYVARLAGNGNGGSTISTGWRVFDTTLGPLPAGVHTLTIGGYNNKKTSSSEQTTVKIDDVLVQASEDEPPTIQSFTVSPSTIPEGGTATLLWTTTDATSVTIDHGIGVQPANGTVNVSPTSTTTYTLSANGDSFPVSAAATVTVVETDLPPGFLDSVVFSGFDKPTSVRFAPDGHVFVAEKSGLIKIFDSLNDTTPDIFADLRSATWDYWDHGCLGLEIDPNWPAEPYVYVMHSLRGNPGGRIVRLTANVANNVAISSTTLLEGWCQVYPSHSIGDLHIGADGALYVSGGDGASFTFTDWGQNEPNNPDGGPSSLSCPDPNNEGGALRSQDLRTSGDPVGYSGTILRLNRSTGLPMANNPLVGGSAGDDAIIAYGLRNPFRFTIDPFTGGLWIADVGWTTIEEINELPNPLASPIRNFGWPCYEGTPRQPGYDSADLAICENLYSSGGVTSPFYSYSHNGNDSAATSVAIYAGSEYPEEYLGALFFGDYSREWIKVMMPDGNGDPDPGNVVTFKPNDAAIVCLQAGPNGDLFYVDIVAEEVRRIQFFGPNSPPTAVIEVDTQYGDSPLTANFDGTSSFDPDFDDSITYAWDLDGDGQFNDSTSATPQWVYTTSGPVTVRLRVTDESENQGIDEVIIGVDRFPPVATITGPDPLTTWQTGQEIVFAGEAFDPDTGAVPASEMEWEILLLHCGALNPEECHEHFMANPSGVDTSSFTGPEHDYPSRVEIRLMVEDTELGMTSTDSLTLYPATSVYSFNTNPSGLELVLQAESVATPFSREVIVGSGVTISAPTPQLSGDTVYSFQSWEHGGPQTQNFPADSSDAFFFAEYLGEELPELVWHSYDVVTQAGAPQATVDDVTLGVSADVLLYESTNGDGVAQGSLFTAYNPSLHVETFNNVENYWANTFGNAYPYAGKSTVNRGSDAGEANAPAPLGVRDLQMHPPNNDHLVVAAFEIPEDGSYTLSDLGVRRIANLGSGHTDTLKVFDSSLNLVASLQALNDRTWVLDPAVYNLGTLTVGDLVYFAIDRDSSFVYDATELAWTVTRSGTSSPPPMINSFTATPGTINLGGSSTLAWTTSEATAVSINNGVGGGLPANGSVLVSPASTTTYTLTATGLGGQTLDTAQVTVNGSSTMLQVSVNSGNDDAEEYASGGISLGSSDLEIVQDGSVQTIGLRFNGVTIPQGAAILSAHVQFQVDESTTEPASLLVQGQYSDNAAVFTSSGGNVSTRPRTSSAVAWNPNPWSVVGAAGADQRTPNIASVIQEIVSRPGWSSGNSLAVIITGSGRRTAEAFEGSPSGAAKLQVEFSTGGPPVNQPPQVDAGESATVTLPAGAILDGTVSDDGLPNPPDSMTTQWSKQSGPGVVNFASSNQVDTTATFSSAGVYVLRLTANDSELAASDEVTITVNQAGSSNSIDVSVSTGNDDVEERGSGSMSLGSSDLELTEDGSAQTIGLRFNGVAIPSGATIIDARVQFQVDETTSGPASLLIQGHDTDSASAFTSTSGNVSSRARTEASVPWSPPDWTAIGAAGAGQQTPNIASVIQEIVSRPGWASGNSVALIISGTGKRVAESANGAAGAEPKLHVEYSTGGPPPNQPPNVNAGEDQFITLPAMANLDGTVTDDGLPDPPGAFTVLWTKVSGPGTVTFGNAALIDTTATFSQAGTYVLRLTGDDGPLDSSDEVTIVANAAGGTTSVNVRVGIGDDDAEEHIASGTVTRFSSDLEMVEDGSPQVIGLRFVGVPIPQDATITAAHVQFQVDEATSGATSLLIQGHAVDNAPPIVSSAFNISSRSRTSAMVAWNPPTWGSVGAAGADQRTTDLSTVIQEIVSREGWSPDNSLMLIITGTGERVAEAWDGGDPSVAPLLHVQYTIDGGSEGSQSPGSRTSN